MNTATKIILAILILGVVGGIVYYFNKKQKELEKKNADLADYIQNNTSSDGKTTGISADSVNQTINGLTNLLKDLGIFREANSGMFDTSVLDAQSNTTYLEQNVTSTRNNTYIPTF
jgi:uncharacterized protein YpmB